VGAGVLVASVIATGAAIILLLGPAAQVRLTPDGAPYHLAVHGTTLVVRNPVSGGGNEREVLYSSRSPVEGTSTTCATWERGQGLTQNGVAFRIHHNGSGFRTVVLERNVFYRAFWSFVLLVFNSNRPAHPFTQLGSASLASYLGTSTRKDVFPLRICAAVSPSAVSFAVAKGSDPMPPLATASSQGATISFDPSAVPGTGRTGTYLAHIPPGTAAAVSGTTIDGAPAPSPVGS
jgi:hypothetical protein